MKFGDDVFQQWIDKLPASYDRVRKRLQNARTKEDTLVELAVGYLLSEVLGHRIDYENEIHGLTPDWYVLSGDGISSFYVEVFKRNPPLETAIIYGKAMNERTVSEACWEKPDLDVLIAEKIRRYHSITEDWPFVVGVAANFFSGVEEEDLIEACMLPLGNGVFARRPELSGVIWIELIEKTRFWTLSPHYNPYAKNPLPHKAVGIRNRS